MNNHPGKETFRPMNEDKYVGDINKIQVRSSWERLFCQWLDTNPMVVNWSSEIMYIEYFDPVRKKKRRYFPDFLMKVEDKNGNLITYLVEVKPYKESHPPRADRRKKKKTRMREEAIWMTNNAKFEAAKEYCRRKGWIFKIITEKELFKGGKP